MEKIRERALRFVYDDYCSNHFRTCSSFSQFKTLISSWSDKDCKCIACDSGEDLYECDSEGTDGCDAVIEISNSDETLPPSDTETQPPLEECGQEVEWSQSP
ncbi:hypothetical protein DPMN_114295 [Dreissena polymorpha]|uniref:Uncharacterized protein n=1 Tax=Dreissena polymorpha TaxID=45954 RepID=A0A9D4QRV5_DREPO|nr:hypothetical protein DPMN_114295 [Dreissena polymorpha]